MQRCEAPYCWASVEPANYVRLYSESGPHKIVHLCERHLAQLVATAGEQNIPVVDFRDD
jgi:hypothetical protein